MGEDIMCVHSNKNLGEIWLSHLYRLSYFDKNTEIRFGLYIPWWVKVFSTQLTEDEGHFAVIQARSQIKLVNQISSGPTADELKPFPLQESPTPAAGRSLKRSLAREAAVLKCLRSGSPSLGRSCSSCCRMTFLDRAWDWSLALSKVNSYWFT